MCSSCSVTIDWHCLRRFIMSLLSDSLTTSWWRARLASLWPGMDAPASTSKWQRSTKAGLVACVEITMMTDQMISAAAMVRQTGRNTLIVSINNQFRSITWALHVAVVDLEFSNAVEFTDVLRGVMQIKGRGQIFWRYHFCGQFSVVSKYIVCD